MMTLAKKMTSTIVQSVSRVCFISDLDSDLSKRIEQSQCFTI